MNNKKSLFSWSKINQNLFSEEPKERCKWYFQWLVIINKLKCGLFLFIIISLTCCGIPNQSILKGTYDGKDFLLKGKIDMLSRLANGVDCAQGISFYPAYPIGDQLGFTLGFKDLDMYQGLKEQVGENLLFETENQIEHFYILGFTNKAIEIDIGDASEGDFFIIENVELKEESIRNSPFEDINQAILTQGKMKLHFGDILIIADFDFVFGQCYD